MSVVDAPSDRGHGFYQPQEGGENRLLLGEEPDVDPKLPDVLERGHGGHAERVARDGSRRHREVLADDLRREDEPARRLDQGPGVVVMTPSLVRRFQQDIRVEEKRVSDRRPRR